MKLVFTIADATLLIHTGGDVERKSYLLEVPDENIPRGVMQELRNRRESTKPGNVASIAISILEEEQEEKK